MEFCKKLDELDNVWKIVLAIIPPVHLIWVIYAIIRDQKNTTLLVLDIIFGLVGPLGLVFYIGNIVTMASRGEVLSFASFIGSDGDKTSTTGAKDAEFVDKD